MQWDNLKQYEDVFTYYKGLIAFRKEHAGLRLKTTEEINSQLSFIEGLENNVVAFHIEHKLDDTNMEHIFVVYNANKESKRIMLPDGAWDVYVNGETAGIDRMQEVTSDIMVEPISAMVLLKEATHF